MASFRNARYGSVESSVLDPTLKSIADSMKIFLNSADDFAYLTSPRVMGDLIKQFKVITGDDFKGWLLANYNNGVGVRASLVRNILSFLNKEINGMMVGDAIVRDERKLVLYENAEIDPINGSTRHIADEHHLRKWVKLLEGVTNDDLYRLVEGVGAEHIARLVITLNGESTDVGRG